jgi:hypothetical protein
MVNCLFFRQSKNFHLRFVIGCKKFEQSEMIFNTNMYIKTSSENCSIIVGQNSSTNFDWLKVKQQMSRFFKSPSRLEDMDLDVLHISGESKLEKLKFNETIIQKLKNISTKIPEEFLEETFLENLIFERPFYEEPYLSTDIQKRKNLTKNSFSESEIQYPSLYKKSENIKIRLVLIEKCERDVDVSSVLNPFISDLNVPKKYSGKLKLCIW